MRIGSRLDTNPREFVTPWIQRFAVVLGLVSALAVGARAERLPIKTYTIADGLAHDSVYRIVQDSHGFLWFCTREGLSRFDGYSFTNYGVQQGLPDRGVADLLEARDGVYWVADSRGGLFRFRPATSGRGGGRPLFEAIALENAGATQSATALVEDRSGVVWCGTDHGLYRSDISAGDGPCVLADFLAPETIVNALLEDRDGALWIAAGDALYRRRANGRLDRYTTRDGLPAAEYPSALLQDREGVVWAGGASGLVRIRPAEDGPPSIAAFSTRDGLAGTHVATLYETVDGRVLAGTDRGLTEVIRGDRSEVAFRNVAAANGLSDSAILAVAEDRDGDVWLGTESGGAMRLARSGFTTYLEADGLTTARIGAVFETLDGKLCTTYSGGPIDVFNGWGFSPATPRIPSRITNHGWGWNQITFQDHLGDWWVTTGEGVCRYAKTSIAALPRASPASIYTSRTGLAGDDAFRLYEDSRGDVWISTINSGGVLTRWERATDTLHRYGAEDGVAMVAPTAFREDRAGNLWIGWYTGGLARYAAGRFTFFTAADGVPTGFVRDIYCDRTGRVWVASAGSGLCRIDDPSAEHPSFATYTTAQGLTSNQVTCVTEDDWGRIYAGTGRGVDRIDLTTGRIKQFTVVDGLANNFVNVAYRARDGALWFGTLHGLSRFVPGPDVPPTPPPVFIGAVRVAGVAAPLADLGQPQVLGLTLEPSRNQLQIEFFGLAFGPGEALRYQYLLDGTDLDWCPPTEIRSVNYENLASGTYRFVVRAVNAEGVASPIPATVEFTILRPVWQRWWFVASLAAIVGLLVFVGDRYRIARLIEIERVRTRIATDLHDDIGSSLSQISVLTEVARRDIDRSIGVSERLSTIADISRDIVDSMSDIVWAINPRRDSLGDLAHRMRWFASDVLEARGIEFDLRTPELDADARVGADVRREVFLIFKEAINNAVRHSGCSRVEIDLVVDDGLLELTVADDGRGFVPERRREGNGLASMQGRAAGLGGAVDVVSAPGTGTTVRFRARYGGRRRWHPHKYVATIARLRRRLWPNR